MAKSATKDKTNTTEGPQPAPAAALPAVASLRLPYPGSLGEYYGLNKNDWQVLIDVMFPLARTAIAVVLAVKYCKARNLDIFKKVVHIVPMRRKSGENTWETVDTIWPGIAEVRITAHRTGAYAGKDAAVFGPTVTEKFQHIDDRNGEVKKELEFAFPEWCRVDVYRMVQGQRCKFEGPKVYWKEAYATESSYSQIPNEMWQDRKSGQHEKCAEAASLRAAFPEELGGEYTAEEMHGRTLDARSVGQDRFAVADGQLGTMTPPRPQQSDFATKPAEAKKPEPKTEAPKTEDGRPEPPPLGEQVQEQVKEQVKGNQLPDLPDSLRREPLPTAPEAQPGPGEGGMSGEPEEDEAAPSEAYMGASSLLDALEEKMPNVEDLDTFKKEGRSNIEKQPGMTDDERDMLRGRFTTMCLTEQKRRAKR